MPSGQTSDVVFVFVPGLFFTVWYFFILKLTLLGDIGSQIHTGINCTT